MVVIKLAMFGFKREYATTPREEKHYFKRFTFQQGIQRKEKSMANAFSMDELMANIRKNTKAKPVVRKSKTVAVLVDIDGKKLAELIDMAAKYSAVLTAQSGMEAEDPSYQLMAAIAALRVDGTATVANVSQGFCDYLMDCFGAMVQ